MVRLTRLPGVVHEVWDLNSAHISVGRDFIYIYVIFKIKTVHKNVMNKKSYASQIQILKALKPLRVL